VFNPEKLKSVRKGGYGENWDLKALQVCQFVLQHIHRHVRQFSVQDLGLRMTPRCRGHQETLFCCLTTLLVKSGIDCILLLQSLYCQDGNQMRKLRFVPSAEHNSVNSPNRDYYTQC
jgi:hypothetical protein